MKNTKKIGKNAAILSLIEIGLGSFLHSFKIPFAGHLLSLNQGFILTRASIKIDDKKSPIYISTAAAIFKSLSPAGKKLTPMLAIAAQGHLYGLSTLLFGNNFLGHLFGMLFLCTWGILQPFAIYFLIFGKDLFFMIQYFISKLQKIIPVTEDNLLYFLLIIIAIKMVIGIILVIMAYLLSEKHFSIYEQWAKAKVIPKKMNTLNPYWGALKDLANPLFLISFFLFFIFLIFAQSSYSQLLWQILRPIAIAYLIFLILRIFPIEQLFNQLKDGKYKEVFKEALKHIQK